METAHLCQCNNCDIVLIDESPSLLSEEYILKGNELEMAFITDINGGYWVCPICLKNDDLQDNITITDY